MNKTQLKTLTIAFIILLINSKPTNCQTAFSNYNIYEEADQLYESLKGPDHDLINGRVLMPSRMKTYYHPYFGNDVFRSGEITINNRHFKNIQLKYDILDQYIIIEFAFDGETTRPIILNNEFIQEFNIEEKHFIHYELPDQGKKYMQKLTGDSLACYYYFYKTSEEIAEGRYYIKEINPTKVNRYIKIGDQLLQYRATKSFIKKFDDNYKHDIKKYIKSRNLDLKTIADKEMKELLIYCESLITNK